MGPTGSIGDYSSIPESELSEETKLRLNRETDAIIKECVREVEELLKKERDLFERFAHELLVKGELDYDEIEAIFAEYGKANPRLFGVKKEEKTSALPPGNGQPEDKEPK